MTLERMRGSIAQPRHYALDTTLNQRAEDAFSQLQTRHAQHEQKVKDEVEKLRRLVGDIELAVTDGLSKQATDLQREAQQLFDALPRARPVYCASRVLSVAGRPPQRNRELWSWKKWAGAPVKERLVEEMEALVRALNEPGDIERDYYAIAQQIQLAREQWKSLGATDNTTAKDLWERFNTACEVAHAPCAAYFSAERAQRANTHSKNRRSAGISSSS